MALIKCPECGKDVSDKASACIHCGFPLSTTAQNTNTQQKPTILTPQINVKAPMKMFSQNDTTVSIECCNCSKVYSYNRKYFSQVEKSFCLPNTAIICPNCNEENDYEAKYCDNCGKQLVKICAKCSMKNDADAVFCKSCGERI